MAENSKEGSRANCSNLKGGISDNDIKNGGHTSEKNLLQKVGIAGKEKKEGEQEVIIKNGGGCQVNK